MVSLSTWNMGAGSSVSGATGSLSGEVNKFKDNFSSLSKRTISEVEVYFHNGATIIGINVNQIPQMKQAVRSYVDGLQKQLDKLNAIDPKTAFKGEISTAIVEFIDAVKQACQAVVSNMLAFNDQLTKVQAAYENRDSEMKSRIKADTEAARSSFTNYTEGAN